MKKSILLLCTLILTFFLFKAISAAKQDMALQDASAVASLQLLVDEKPLFYAVPTVGMNIGRWTPRGSEQLAANIVLNPGLEGVVDRIIVIVSHTTASSFSDEAGLGYPDHYWNNATFDVRSGSSAGRKGVIRRSVQSGEQGLPEYFTEEPPPYLEANDVVVLTKEVRRLPSHLWKFTGGSSIEVDPYHVRAEGLGRQSIALASTRDAQAQMNYSADTTATRTGIQLPVQGAWRLDFWAKAEKEGAQLEVSFRRENKQSPFLQEVVALETDWHEITMDFTAQDGKEPAPLNLVFTSLSPGNKMWIDDVFLASLEEEESAFSTRVISTIQQLRPSYLREFAHVSDLFENRVASTFQRRPFIYRIIGGHEEQVYNYSLDEFFDLCDKVHADPWLIVPSTFSDYECKKLGEFLVRKGSKDRFKEVIVEFGYSSWSWLMRPAGIPYPLEYGKVAERCFRIISKEIAGKSAVRFFINGSPDNLSQSMQIFQEAKLAEGLAVPYTFFSTLDKGTPDKEVLEKLFDRQDNRIALFADELFEKGKSLAIAEINLLTTQGSAGSFERNRAAAGRASGVALAKKILTCLYAGANPIIVNGLTPLDTPVWETGEFVSLWGVVKNFGPPPAFRPTGLAVIMLNKALGGNLHAVYPHEKGQEEAELLTAAAFKKANSWTAVVISHAEGVKELEITFPDDGHPLPTHLLLLESKSPFDTNEFQPEVSIAKREVEISNRTVKCQVPAWSLIVLTD